MTTLIAIDGHKPGGRRSVEVARRFRAELGALDISASEAARRCSRTQAWMARRTSGKTAFDVDDLDMVCSVLGISYDYVATGIREIPSPPPGGGIPFDHPEAGRGKKNATEDYQSLPWVA
jgi:transcriptional regulator with XRE-family HTH domain